MPARVYHMLLIVSTITILIPKPFNCRVFVFNYIVGGNSNSRLSLCFVAIRRSLLQEETDVACAITGELNGSGFSPGLFSFQYF